MTTKFALLFSLSSIVSCGDSSKNNEDSQSPTGEHDTSMAMGELADTKIETIIKFAQDKGYSTWTSTSIHAKSLNSPHGMVKTFFNDTIKKSIEASATTHPVGSITFKELYDSDGATIKGYAANIKIKEGEGKETWLFYEGFQPNYDTYYGVGLSVCTSCHSSGTDYVREPLP